MLDPAQITALTAQARKATNNSSRDSDGQLLTGWESLEGVDIYTGSQLDQRGVGVYGQTPENLVSAGYLKSSALDLIEDSVPVDEVLGTDTYWTGLDGIDSLRSYLVNVDIQNKTQIDLMSGAYQGLVDALVLSGSESSRTQAALIQPSVKYGVDAVVAWITDQTSTNLTLAINNTARQAQYAIDFVSVNADLTQAGEMPQAENTAVRDQLNQAITALIDDPKIPENLVGGASVQTPPRDVAAAIAAGLTGQDPAGRFRRVAR